MPPKGYKPKVRAPFPFFGGKTQVSDLVWQHLGDVGNYLEPFAGSLAVLLNRPHAGKFETVNDLDGNIANFWRAVQEVPAQVARYASDPFNEIELHARHRWLFDTYEERLRYLTEDPFFYDVRVAGWWLWGISASIGDSFNLQGRCQMPYEKARPGLFPPRGVHSLKRRGGKVETLLRVLSQRLQNVRVLCGDWSRLVTDGKTRVEPPVGVFLDPPYEQHEHMYRTTGFRHVTQEVQNWAVTHGDDPNLRIALCGYAGTNNMPPGWKCIPWRASGGYRNQGADSSKNKRDAERVWFSPHCLDPA